MNRSTSIYQDMAARTGGSIYIGVVGPVRTGKSTFIKRFMETQVLPHIDNAYRRDRAQDELPQSGSGRTIMTAEPKFVPEEAVCIRLEDDVTFSVRLIDCVGYMVPGAMGQFEDLSPRMVMTPWYDHEIPMTEAAEIGTRKVITDHSTVGIVITTDGTITDIPREDYLEAEERVIRELQEIGKPFLVLLNSADPRGSRAASIAAEIGEKFGVSCLPVNCLALEEQELRSLLQGLLYEFPLQELDVFLPPWVDALPGEHPIKSDLYQRIAAGTAGLHCIRQLAPYLASLQNTENVESAGVDAMDLGQGVAQASIRLPRGLFYTTLSQRSGLSVSDDGDLMELLTELAEVRKAYDKVAPALIAARETGYGIRMRASAPSIHMIRADVSTTVSPIVGNEKQSEEMVNYLLRQFEGDTGKIWESNIFGRSFNEIAGEDLQAKLKRMPPDAQAKLREALERIINEGGGGLICIIL